MKNRIMAGVVAAEMILCFVFSTLPVTFAADKAFNIKSIADFEAFAEKCTFDTWSCGKTVNLMCDIDFSKSEFKPIPMFCGTFNGNGYTVSGIKFTKKGSYQGLFRYIGAEGTVSNLNVQGDFLPGGSKSFIGGIAGENRGTIENCSFDGTINGENVIGGITGNNTDSGRIISCTASGDTVGENSTGGITGKNSGFISDCTNNSSVNTVYEEKKNDISNIDTDAGAIIENYKSGEAENKEESLLGHTDTGGIAGYSSGIMQGCINNGAVGYKHIGYNVGGIAGRQCGYMLGCENYGFVQGRKDVGGIVGQAEPYIVLNTSEGMLRDLKYELDTLNSMINKFITDTDDLGNSARKHLDGISQYTESARENTEIMLNKGTDFIDDNVDEINAQTAILSNTLDKLVPVFESLESGSEELAEALDDIASVFDDLEINAPNLSDDLDDIKDALEYISHAERSIRKAIKRIRWAKEDLEDAVSFKNSVKVEKAVSDISDALKDIINARNTIKKSVEDIKTILESKPESFGEIGINAKKIAANLKTMAENNKTVITSLEKIRESINTIILNTDIDYSKFKSASQNMEESVDYLCDTIYYITNGLQDLTEAVKNITDKTVTDELTAAKEDLADGIHSLSYATDDIKTAIGDLKDIISDLSAEDSFEFVKLGDDFKNANEKLFNSLGGISDEINGLKNTISDEKDKITGDLSSINNQFNLVMNLLINEVEELKNGNRSLEDIFLDVSDEDIENVKQGKLADCRNSGKVEADRNIGGIVGAAAIEYSKDPEDETEKPNTLNFTYRTRTVLQKCVNDGEIIGKKNCAGGIVGHAEIGTVYRCENYGTIKSENGNYVGGIAGNSNSAIRKCYAKNKSEGKRYVGGIAGNADTITGSCAIVNINGEENIGAICGNSEKNNLYGNLFCDNGLGAVDGISYKGKAEPTDFEYLKTLSDIPRKFISFTVTFTADEKIVATQDIKYGDDTARIKYPDIPAKDGYFGKWKKTEAEIVTENIEIVCEYQPYITVLSSKEKNESGKLSIAICEGEFNDEAELKVTESQEKPPIKAAENVKTYNISLTNANTCESRKLHLLNENRDKVTAWCLKNGNWEKLKTSSRGKYVIMNISGEDNTICLKYEKKSFGILMLTFVLVLAAGAFVLVKSSKQLKHLLKNHIKFNK